MTRRKTPDAPSRAGSPSEKPSARGSGVRQSRPPQALGTKQSLLRPSTSYSLVADREEPTDKRGKPPRDDAPEIEIHGEESIGEILIDEEDLGIPPWRPSPVPAKPTRVSPSEPMGTTSGVYASITPYERPPRSALKTGSKRASSQAPPHISSPLPPPISSSARSRISSPLPPGVSSPSTPRFSSASTPRVSSSSTPRVSSASTPRVSAPPIPRVTPPEGVRRTSSSSIQSGPRSSPVPPGPRSSPIPNPRASSPDSLISSPIPSARISSPDLGYDDRAVPRSSTVPVFPTPIPDPRASDPGIGPASFRHATPPPASAPPARSSDPGPISARVPLRKTRRVLCVSDNAETIRDVTRLLLSTDAELVVVKTPAEASRTLDAMDGRKPTPLVFLDVLLSSAEGTALVEQLRAHDHAVGARIVLLSSFSGQTMEEMRRSWGADASLATNRGVLHMDGRIREWLSAQDFRPRSTSSPSNRRS